MSTLTALPVGQGGDACRPPALWKHQTEAIEFALARPGAMLDIGMGGGKSRIAIEVADRVRAHRLLVLCPKNVIGVWPRELGEQSARPWRTWSGRVDGPRGPLATPTVARRAATLVEQHAAALRLNAPLMVIVNFDACWRPQLAASILGIEWDLVILDESHRIKSPSGKASRFADKLGARTRKQGGRVLAMTGTSAPHSPLDLWGQLRALDGGERLGSTYARFCQRYGRAETIRVAGGQERTVYKGVRDDALARLVDQCSEIVFRVGQDDLDAMLGLPEIVDTYRVCELAPATRQAYDTLQKDLVAEIEAGAFVEAANAMVLTTRLAQLSGGFSKTHDGELVQISSPPEKAVLLADVLDDLPSEEPVVVFCRFHADLDAIRDVAERLGRTYGELSGRRRDGLTDDSRMAERDVVGVQLQSGGVGVDFTRARYGIYYSLDFNLGNHAQSRKRLHRPGQTRRTTFVTLLAEDTIDFAVYGALKRRKDVVHAVLSRIGGTSTPNERSTP